MAGESIQPFITTTIKDSYGYRGVGLACMAIFMSLLLAANISRAVRFYMKYYLYNSMYILIGTVCIPFMLMSPGDPDNVR